MAGFTKLFNSILFSTIWQEPNEMRILWITLLAMSDSRGQVQASVPGLAKTAGITIAECEAALERLSSPDPYSRTPDYEGRRIEKVDGGWQLLNHAKYRALMSAEERREYNRKKQEEWRAKNKGKAVTPGHASVTPESRTPPKDGLSKDVNDTSITVNDNKQSQHITEAEAEAEAYTDNLLLDVGEITPPKVGRKPSQRQGVVDDEEWIVSLEKDSAYAGIPIRVELGKMQRWCEVRHKSPSRARFINWLNRAEKPIGVNGQHRPKHAAYDPASATAGATADEIGKF